ncbi:hypothetical protein DOTSEDRAFT_75037 [Dothistroma septosporum NZE10]|uniref:Uncharacterized protein n=1 Tax=Dothistroma septosporum (strain NZE10 / CBS 128990) TaxID=675120 RepID=M2YJS2_DOTSN|nr:hypothetical protein DOTSEDRAFT_75037 [Dothistroma septosporum NZE10]
MTQHRKDSTRYPIPDDIGPTRACPVQCAAVAVVSALSFVFYRSPATTFDGPPPSPLDCSFITPFDRPTSGPLKSFRSTADIPQSQRVGNTTSESILARKAQLTQRRLGEHLFLPGVQMDKSATIEHALADARFMNQLLPSHAIDVLDSAQMVERLLRLVEEVEVDIAALRQESKLELSTLERKILRTSTYCAGKLGRSLQSLKDKLHNRQNAAFIRLAETASVQAGCNPPAAVQSTICPAIIRRPSIARPAAPEKHQERLRRPSMRRQRSDSTMAVYNLENMSL